MISQPASHNKSGIHEARLLKEWIGLFTSRRGPLHRLGHLDAVGKGIFQLHHYASIMTPLPAAM